MQQLEMDQGRLKRMEHGQTCADVPENARTRLPKKRGGLSRYHSSETGIYFLEATASSRKPETGQTENSRDFVDTRSRWSFLPERRTVQPGGEIHALRELLCNPDLSSVSWEEQTRSGGVQVFRRACDVQSAGLHCCGSSTCHKEFLRAALLPPASRGNRALIVTFSFLAGEHEDERENDIVNDNAASSGDVHNGRRCCGADGVPSAWLVRGYERRGRSSCARERNSSGSSDDPPSLCLDKQTRPQTNRENGDKEGQNRAKSRRSIDAVSLRKERSENQNLPWVYSG